MARDLQLLNLTLAYHQGILERGDFIKKYGEITEVIEAERAAENLVRNGMVDRIRHGDTGDSGDHRLRVRDIPYSI